MRVCRCRIGGRSGGRVGKGVTSSSRCHEVAKDEGEDESTSPASSRGGRGRVALAVVS